MLRMRGQAGKRQGLQKGPSCQLRLLSVARSCRQKMQAQQQAHRLPSLC